MSLRAIGMIRFLFIVSLYVTQALSVHVETIYGKANERTTISGDVKNARSCFVVTNNGEEIDFQKFSSFEPDDIVSVNNYECALSLRMTSNMEGSWTIKSTFGNEAGKNVTKHKSFNVKVKNVLKREDVLPSHEMTATDGNYVIAYLETHKNMTTCTLLDQHGFEYNISAMEQNKNELNFMSKYEQCGVRIKVNDSHIGEWKLFAHLGSNETRIGTFKINVIPKLNDIESVKDMYAQLGSKSYRLIFAQNGFYCEIKDPQKNVVAKKQGSCIYDIPIVTSHHRGSWFATYYTKGHLIERYSEIRLHTFDANTVNATVTYDKNGNIQLLCRYNSEVRITVCRFEDPRKNVILVNPGTGTEKYEYFGKGFGYGYYNNLYQDCGITIREPTDHDFGIWRCLVNIKDKSMHEGSILHVKSEPDASRKVTIESKVYVQQGSSFKIKCNAQSALKYCSIKSPNGTMYFTTTRKELLPKSVAYEGAGLELGECGAKLPGANYSDAGDWSCHMGLQRGPELEARVPVIVTESSIMAVEDRIELSSADMPITLSCVPIPGSEFDIDYCRWIKPDGTIVQSEVDAENSNETNHQYCRMTITENKYANIGKWTCIVGIKYGVNSEAQADIFVDYNSNSVYFILLGTSFLVTAVAIIAFFIYRNNSRERMKDYLIDFKM